MSLTDIIKAKFNTAVEKMENPIEMFDQSLREKDKALSTAKMASAEVLGKIHQAEKQMNDALAASNDCEAKVKRAMTDSAKASAAENMELAGKCEAIAKEALARKHTADALYESLKASYLAQKAEGDKLKQNLHAHEKELADLHNSRAMYEARYATAEAGEKLGEISANLGSSHISMDRIERQISEKEARAAGLSEISQTEESLDDQLAALEATNLDDELEKYRVK